jgi:hypothetical protein
MTNIPLKAKVQCSDGASGHSTSAIIDPTTFQLTHIVVNDTNLHSDPTRLVPLKTIKSVADGEVMLICTKGELAAMKPFVSTGYVGVSTSNKKAGASKTPVSSVAPDADSVQEEHIPEGVLDIPFNGTDPQFLLDGPFLPRIPDADLCVRDDGHTGTVVHRAGPEGAPI